MNTPKACRCGKPAVFRLIHAIREHERSLHAWFVSQGLFCEECRERMQHDRPYPMDFRPVEDELPESY